MIALHPLWVIALLVIIGVFLAPVVAAVVLMVGLSRRQSPAAKQLADGTWISADGQWEWNGEAWIRRSVPPA